MRRLVRFGERLLRDCFSAIALASLFLVYNSMLPAPAYAQTITCSFGTGIVLPVGSPVVSTANGSIVNGQPIVSQRYFVNQYPLCPPAGHYNPGDFYMWVSVQNSTGQTVGIFLGSAASKMGQNISVSAALLNLPKGHYAGLIFVTTPSGTVLSVTNTIAINVG